MIVGLEHEFKKRLNADVLSAICKLAGIGEAGDAPLEIHTQTEWTAPGEVLRVRINRFVLEYEKGTIHKDPFLPQSHKLVRTSWDKNPLAEFQMTLLPQNYDFLWSHNVFIHEYFRRRGIGRLLHGYRLEAAKAAGASGVLCSVRSDNVAERKLLFDFGWKQGAAIRPTYARTPETEYFVEFWSKEL